MIELHWSPHFSKQENIELEISVHENSEVAEDNKIKVIWYNLKKLERQQKYHRKWVNEHNGWWSKSKWGPKE